MTTGRPRIVAGAVGTSVLGVTTVALIERASTAALVRDPRAIPILVAGVAALGVVAFRPLWRGSTRPYIGRLVVSTYFILLCLGLLAVHLLKVMGRDGYPIAVDQRLPADTQLENALNLGLEAGIALLLGWMLTRLVSRPALNAEAAPTEEHYARMWATYRSLMPALLGLGLLGCAILTAATSRVPLFSADIDTVRYAQGSGLGFASLLEYELLLVSGVAASGLVVDKAWRGRWASWLGVSLILLLLFRVERTPFVVATLVVVITAVASRRQITLVTAVGVLFAVVSVVFGLGVVRLASSGELRDIREAVARPLYDIAPEFREQAYVYAIYPELKPYTAKGDMAAILTSVLPGRALSLVGVDKGALYSDVSREYSQTMRQLGYYPHQVKPLRVGIVGEMYADFGRYGMWVAMSVFGVGLTCLEIWSSRDAGRLLVSVLAGAFCVMALITPPPALLPIALVVIGTAVAGARPRLAE